jgi:uncharacterized membrane protein
VNQARTRIGALLAHLATPSMERARDVARATFWLVPAVCVLVSIGLAVGLLAIDDAIPVHHTLAVFPGPPSGARNFLSSIIQAMISFTALVFSITIVVLQLSSGQFSPRVLRMFLADRSIQFTLGTFIATFVYAMVVHRAVRGTDGHADAFVPRISVTVAFALVLLSVGLFIHYISHVANMIRVITIITHIGVESRKVLGERHPAGAAPCATPQELPDPVLVIPTPHAGVTVSVNEPALVDLARKAGCVLLLRPRVGDFLPAGAPLVTVHPDRVGSLPRIEHGFTERVVGEVALDTERTMEQDLAFGFRQLVDIAERALSPALNDPTTATQAIDVLHDLLRQLASRNLADGQYRDDEGSLRLRVPQYRFEDLLDLAVREIWHYGAEAAQVHERLTVMLDDLGSVALPGHRAAIAAWSERLARPPRDRP